MLFAKPPEARLLPQSVLLAHRILWGREPLANGRAAPRPKALPRHWCYPALPLSLFLRASPFAGMLRSYQGLLTGLGHPIQAKFIYDDTHKRRGSKNETGACLFFFFLITSVFNRKAVPSRDRTSRTVVGWWEGGPGILVFVLNQVGPLPPLGPCYAQPLATGGPRSWVRGLPGCWLCSLAVCGDEVSTVAGCQACLVNRCRQHLLCSAGTVGSFAAGLLLGPCCLHLTGSDSVNPSQLHPSSEGLWGLWHPGMD